MNTRALPPHGSYARANGSPGGKRPQCNCAACTRTRRLAKKQYRINKERGLPGRVDATPARRHLELLHATMSWNRIVETVGCASDTIFNIANGNRTHISRRTHEAILAIKPSYQISGGLYVESIGSTRRLQALQAAGHSIRAITEAMPRASEENVRLATRGERPRIRAAFAAKIDDVYKLLRDQPGDPHIAETAIAKGYLPPHVWDADIDDPSANPCAGEPDHQPRSDALVSRDEQQAIAKAMTLAGRPAGEIAERLNVSSRTVVRWRTANGWKAAA